MANTTDTPANTPDNTPVNTSQNTPDALGELTAAIEAALDQGLPCLVELYQITASGRVPVSKMDGDKFDAFALGVPAGKYMARAKVNGKYVKSATIIVDGPAHNAAALPAPQAAPVHHGHDPNNLIAMMMQQSASNQQMMMTLFTSSQQQMTSLLTTVLSNKAEDKSKVSEIVEAVKNIHDLAPGGDKSELGELAEVFAPIIAAAAAKNGADTVTLTREQVDKIKAKLAAAKQNAQKRPALPAPKANPAATVETKPVAPPNQPKQTLVEAQPGEPAAQSMPVWVPEIGRTALEKLRGCYKIGISAAAAGTALFDLLDQSPEGAQFVGGIVGADASEFVKTIAPSVPEFATSIGAAYAQEAIEELQEQVKASLEDEMGLSDETDELNDDADRVDADAA
jgi:hypothetical protein